MTFTELLLIWVLITVSCNIALTIIFRTNQATKGEQIILDALYGITHEYMVDIAINTGLSTDVAKSYASVKKATEILKLYKHRGYANLL